MPTITLSKKALERLVGKKLPDAIIKDTMIMLGTGFEGIEGDAVSVEVFPNRPDLLSEAGMARALASLLGIKTGLRKYDARKGRYTVVVDKSVNKVRPRTACAVVTGIAFDDERIKEIIQMQEKLHVTYCRNRRKAAIGIYPLDKISWPVSYEARKSADIKFTPLEASREMSATQILGTHPAGRAYGHLLEGQEKYPLFVDAHGNVMSMPPIINADSTGRVTRSTHDVFVECSGFDQDVLDRLLGIIVCALADEGGTVHTVEVNYGPSKHVTPDLDPSPMKFDPLYVCKRLGLQLKESELRTLLGKMGLGYQAGKAIVPPYRVDILHPIDIAEEVMVAYGINAMEPQASGASTIGAEDPKSVFRARIANMLVGLGLLEANTYNLDNVINQTSRCNTKGDVVQLANSLTLDYNALRSWLVPSLLGVLRANRHHEYPQRFFTSGMAFSHVKGTDTGVAETLKLAVAVSHARADYTEVRQIIDHMMKLLGLECTIKDVEQDWAIPGRAAGVSVKDKCVAALGEVHPGVLVKWDLEMPVTVIELSLDALFECVQNQ